MDLKLSGVGGGGRHKKQDGGIKRKSSVGFPAETAKFGFTARSRHPHEATGLALSVFG